MELFTPTMVLKDSEDVVEVKVWETYLLYHPAQLYKTLTKYSLDNGPLDTKDRMGRIVFRFNTDHWENHVQQLLYQYRIPIIVKNPQIHLSHLYGRQASRR